MMTCLSGTLTRKERNRTGSQSLNITAYSTTTFVASFLLKNLRVPEATNAVIVNNARLHNVNGD